MVIVVADLVQHVCVLKSEKWPSAYELLLNIKTFTVNAEDTNTQVYTHAENRLSLNWTHGSVVTVGEQFKEI